MLNGANIRGYATAVPLHLEGHLTVLFTILFLSYAAVFVTMLFVPRQS